MKKYTIALEIQQFQVLIVGGGAIALRKIQGLQTTGAHITVVAPEVDAQIKPLVQQVEQRPFEFSDLLGKDMIFCCTNSQTLNHRIASSASKDQFVNNTSDHQDSNFYNLASFQQSGLNIHIGSEGHQVKRVRAMKQELQNYFQKKD